MLKEEQGQSENSADDGHSEEMQHEPQTQL